MQDISLPYMSFFSSFFLLSWSEKVLLLYRLRLKALIQQYQVFGIISHIRMQDYSFLFTYILVQSGHRCACTQLEESFICFYTDLCQRWATSHKSFSKQSSSSMHIFIWTRALHMEMQTLLLQTCSYFTQIGYVIQPSLAHSKRAEYRSLVYISRLSLKVHFSSIQFSIQLDQVCQKHF